MNEIAINIKMLDKNMKGSKEYNSVNIKDMRRKKEKKKKKISKAARKVVHRPEHSKSSKCIRKNWSVSSPFQSSLRSLKGIQSVSADAQFDPGPLCPEIPKTQLHIASLCWVPCAVPCAAFRVADGWVGTVKILKIGTPYIITLIVLQME